MYTIVGPKFKKACMSRPDWPEIERKAKAVYGEGWKLVTPDEYVELTESKAKPDTPSR